MTVSWKGHTSVLWIEELFGANASLKHSIFLHATFFVFSDEIIV